MGLFSGLFGGGAKGGGGGTKRYRHKGGWGKPGSFRKERNGDRVGRGSDGRYKK